MMAALRRFALGTLSSIRNNQSVTSICRHASTRRPEVHEAANMMDIGNRAIFNEDHDIFRQNVRRFFQEEVLPHHAEWEKAGEVSRELWLKAGENGLLGIPIKEEHGGVGGDFLSAAIMIEEQGYANTSGPGFALHSDVAVPYISHYGSEEQIKKYIPDLVAGKKIASIAMSEPAAGSDLQGIKTYAKRDGDDWILNGSKTFITNGWMCDLCIVVTKTNPEAKSPAHGISLFLVDANTPGFKKGSKLQKIGLKAQDTAELFFDDVRLPSSAVLGEVNKGFYYLMEQLPQERIVVGVLGQAAMECMYETTKEYCNTRKAFGGPLVKMQTVQHKLAEIKTEVSVGRAFMDQCLAIHNESKLSSVSASMVKYWLSDLQNSIATRCLQLHGGYGYMWEYPIAKAFVDSRVQPIYAGSNEIMKELIARSCIDQ